VCAPSSISLRHFIAVLCLPALAACTPDQAAPPQVTGGDARIGQRLVSQYQCGSCHQIPDVPAAFGQAGPPLQSFGLRSYIAGQFPNEPEALVRWLGNPPAMKPGTLMPDMGVSPADARHMAAYLYTLQ
jgi:cytochrome c